MPEVSRFYGVVIRMFFNEHNPPHFHAQYGDDMALIEIATLSVFAGQLPPRALGLVIEWAATHRQELLDNWERARQHGEIARIGPLR